jgi:aspartate ammonia-lyase
LVRGLKADNKRCPELMEKSEAMVTALGAEIGYDQAAKIAREALVSGKSLKMIVIEKNILNEDKIRKIFDPYSMTDPFSPG